MGRTANVREIPNLDIGGLLRRGRAPEDSVAVRMPSKASDDIAVSIRPVQIRFPNRPQMLGTLVKPRLAQRDHPFHTIQVVGAFGMDQRQREEALLPIMLSIGVEH